MASTSCPHCRAELPEGARICRACGKLVEGGDVKYAAGGAPPSKEGAAAVRRVSATAGSPKCEVCEPPPNMVRQVEKGSPVVPAIMGFVAFLLLLASLGLGWIPRLVLWAIAGGLVFAAFKMMSVERHYWLCPRCGDTIEIDA